MIEYLKQSNLTVAHPSWDRSRVVPLGKHVGSYFKCAMYPSCILEQVFGSVLGFHHPGAKGSVSTEML